MATEKTVFVSFGILSGMEAFALIVSNFTVGGHVRVAHPDTRIRVQRNHDNLDGGQSQQAECVAAFRIMMVVLVFKVS